METCQTAKVTTNKNDVEVVMHFAHMFKNFVKPAMEAKYAKENKGAKMGAYFTDKDGNEKLLDDIIIEHATTKGTDGAK